MLHWTEITVDSGLVLKIVASDTGIRAIEFPPPRPVEAQRNDSHPLMRDMARQLHAYFTNELRRFDIPLDMAGTAFQKRVWSHLETIPFGETRSYLQVAEAIGAKNAVRAVGAANGSNPVPIVVPCHRVIGSSGKLVGYGGGLELKKRLLELEGTRAMGLKYDA
jgi:methylated-DNA-[protein]-cysteine S-methyltransferase